MPTVISLLIIIICRNSTRKQAQPSSCEDNDFTIRRTVSRTNVLSRYSWHSGWSRLTTLILIVNHENMLVSTLRKIGHIRRNE